jgi:F-type H+-transporting ATPase subunit b
MTYLNFGIVCFLFYRYARKPLLKFLDARAREVAETLEHSRRTKEEAGGELRAAIRRLAGVEEEKKQILQLATEVSEKQRAMMLEDAQRAADRVAEQLDADIERARYLARERVTELLANQAVEEAERHIAQTITQEDHAALIGRFIEQLDRTMVV